MAEVDYRPRGRDGSECSVTPTPSPSLAVSRTLEDATPAVHGDLELTSNAALVTNAWAYAKHEAFRRRRRADEKQKSHEQQAQIHKWAAAVVADMASKVGDESRQGWCSACFSFAAHRVVKGFRGPTRSYLCGACGAPTTACTSPSCKPPAERVAAQRRWETAQHKLRAYTRSPAFVEALAWALEHKATLEETQ